LLRQKAEPVSSLIYGHPRAGRRTNHRVHSPCRPSSQHLKDMSFPTPLIMQTKALHLLVQSILQAFLLISICMATAGCGDGSKSGSSPSSSTAATTAPAITAQPASLTVTTGSSATFSVTATGTAPLAYQWRRSGATINGATSSSYRIASTTTADNGSIAWATPRRALRATRPTGRRWPASAPP